MATLKAALPNRQYYTSSYTLLPTKQYLCVFAAWLLRAFAKSMLQKQVVEASNVLFGSPALYTSTAISFYDHFNIKPGSAVILALKDHDPTAPAAIYTVKKHLSLKEKEGLSDWVCTICHLS